MTCLPKAGRATDSSETGCHLDDSAILGRRQQLPRDAGKSLPLVEAEQSTLLPRLRARIEVGDIGACAGGAREGGDTPTLPSPASGGGSLTDYDAAVDSATEPEITAPRFPDSSRDASRERGLVDIVSTE